MIDLRSDTVTHPTEAMRRAMAAAEVGDDVFGEDPTVRRLEEAAADAMGKAAAMLVPSGTMGNLAALLTHCARGDEIIVGDQSHTIVHEVGGMAGLGGIMPRTVPNRPDGTIDPDLIEAAVRPDFIVFPPTRLVALENTHNGCGGAALDADYMGRVRAVADRHGLAVHLDGARIFNAAVALGIPASELAFGADSVTFCLSKGLSAPVGSVLCGSADFVARARKVRKMLGGGMRQAGVVAAAGLVALQTMVERLAEDHANARRLADGLSALPGIRIDPSTVRTNIVVFELEPDAMPPAELVAAMSEHGVKIFGAGGRKVRAVTHRHISVEDIEAALAAMEAVLAP